MLVSHAQFPLKARAPGLGPDFQVLGQAEGHPNPEPDVRAGSAESTGLRFSGFGCLGFKALGSALQNTTLQ